MLASLNLVSHPFIDRTAEKAQLPPRALYVHSDLQGFVPNDSTYVFFGRRGSGKTTIRLQMQAAYESANAEFQKQGKLGHLIVDLARPGTVSSFLERFREKIKVRERRGR